MKGTLKGRAKEWALGHSSNGKEQVAVMFEITQGEHAGQHITWFGYFTEATCERTLDSLRHCGWDGDDFVNLAGLDSNEVDLVVDEEEYEGKTRTKVQWVNKPARLSMRDQMDKAQLSSFAAKMRGRALQHKQKYGAQPAPSKPAAQQQRQAAPRDDMDPDPSVPRGAHNPGWQAPTDDDIPF